MSGASLIKTLSSRCLLKSVSSDLPEKLVLYAGFDITRSSLQLGNLIPIRILRIAHYMGHRVIGLTGSFTTLLGDPTGKSETRPLLSEAEIKKNVEIIGRQIQFLSNADLMVDNMEWFQEMSLMEFMRNIASKTSVNQLLSAETFKNRIENHLHLSFMEFSYSLLQAYDMYHLSRNFGCNVQVGGSDQWFNMTQGVSYCRRLGAEVSCITADLLVKADGTKMGKSASGAIFLDKSLTSPYDFWQFWRNTEDADVKRCLLQMTDIPIDEIDRLVEVDLTEAKKLLADEVTRWVHGEAEQKAAREKSESIFERRSTDKMDVVIWDFEKELPLDKLLARVSIFSSISEAKRQILSGSITIDGEKKLNPNELIYKGNYVICFGKRKFLRIIWDS